MNEIDQSVQRKVTKASNSKHKKSTIILIILGFMLVTVVLFMFFSRSSTIFFVQAGTLNVRPGERFEIYPGTSLIGKSGTMFSVPDILFGENYRLNNPEVINYVPLNNKISLLHKNETYRISNSGCKTSRKWDYDIIINVVDSCRIKVAVDSDVTFQQSTLDVKESVPGDSDTRPIYNRNYSDKFQGVKISQNPLLYALIPEFRVWGTDMGGAPDRSGGQDYEFNFPLVTNFGTADIVFIPSELFEGVTKQVIIGPATISITPVNKRVPYSNFNKDFSFEYRLKITDEFSNDEIIILDYEI